MPASLKGDTVCKISCGSNHNLALTEKGRVYAWGANGKNQLGLGGGNTKDQAMPQLV
jgi:alpha-tubulin suppressor-like RCC1 family protein